MPSNSVILTATTSATGTLWAPFADQYCICLDVINTRSTAGATPAVDTAVPIRARRVGATLSSRAYRMWAQGKPWGRALMPVIDTLFFWQEKYPGAIGHCHGAYLKELRRYNMPPEMRGTTNP